MKALHSGATLAAVLAAPLGFASLTTSYAVDGNVAGELAGAAHLGHPTASGSLSVGAMPGGATVLQAYLYTNGWFGTASTTANFNGNALGGAAPFANDGGVYAYRWDVTSLISGNGSYTYDFTDGTSIFGVSLAVVYSHASLGLGRVVLNDGAHELGESGAESGSTTFGGFSAGPGVLSLFTQADNASGETGETIDFNGSTVGGPIDGNIGDFASLFNINVNTIAGDNTATIHTGADHFGWQVAMLSSPVPEPGTMAAIGVGLAALARRRRKA